MIIANGYDSMRAGLIISLVVFKIIEAIADPFYGIMQAHGKLYLAGMSMTIKTVASVVFFVIVDILTGNLILSSLCFVVVNALFLVFFDIPRAKKCEY